MTLGTELIGGELESTSSTSAMIAGVVAALTLMSPVGAVVGSTPASVAGPTATVTISAVAGAVTGSQAAAIGGPTLSLTLAAPDGVVSTSGAGTVAGPSASATVQAPSGTATGNFSATVSGPTAITTVTAPAGTVDTPGTVGGATSTVAVAAPAGQVSAVRAAAVPGATATVILTAHAGLVAGGKGANVAATPATLVFSSTPGEVVGQVLDRTKAAVQIALDPSTIESPNTVLATITNAPPGANLKILLNGVGVLYQGSVDSAGVVRAHVHISVATTGAHTVSTDLGGSATITVTAVAPAEETTTGGQTPPMPLAINRWTFQAYDFVDVNAVYAYELPRNPERMSRNFGVLNLSSEATTVSNGRVITWEGAARPVTWSWSGRVLTQAEYREMVRWGQTDQRFYVTDHWGQRYLMKVASCTFKRVRDIERPWHHTYEMTAWALAGAGVAT